MLSGLQTLMVPAIIVLIAWLALRRDDGKPRQPGRRRSNAPPGSGSTRAAGYLTGLFGASAIVALGTFFLCMGLVENNPVLSVAMIALGLHLAWQGSIKCTALVRNITADPAYHRKI